jgi:hypothetical protein
MALITSSQIAKIASIGIPAVQKQYIFKDLHYGIEREAWQGFSLSPGSRC